MSKELEELKIIRQSIIDMLDKGMSMDGDIAISLEKRLDNIETALKDYEKQDNIINIIKEIIEFNIQEPEMKVKENGEISLISRVGMGLRKQINGKEKELFREWVLKECFPKELKALEIIKEKRVDITTLMDCRNAEEYNRWVPIRSHYSYQPFNLTQEEFDLLKEMLL